MRSLLPLLLSLACSMTACRSERPAPPALDGALFPSVAGEALDGRKVELPGAVAGAPAVLLVAFEMETQFDCDRWLLGLVQAQTPVAVLEVPTLPGMVPGLISGTIDAGMREGIPSEDWGVVVTLYGDDAERLFEFTGGVRDRNARVLLLDRDGRVVWHHARGYSARLLAELDQRVRALNAAPAAAEAPAASPSR
ncbi:MAG: hypothetical protein JNL90_20860 [Planctomycetes bacterium]|nr:hypothetical protein [Planctomycetota bacterium]